jgi:hypothetical protein
MPASESEVLVGRRYLERGFLDAAMRLFVRNAELVVATDWTRLADRLLERNRIPDAVRVCELGGVPLPRERLLAAADGYLKRKDVDGAVRLYELAGADRERWTQVVDLLTGIPDRERQAIEIVERHLGPDPDAEPPVEQTKPTRDAKAPRQIKAVK